MKRTVFYILSLLLLAACSDVIVVPEGGNGIDASSSITVKLALPLWEQSEVRSRAVTENALSGDVTVLFFDSEKAALGKESVTPKVEGTKYTITINAPKGTKYLHIVANTPSGSFATANDPAKEATSVAIDGYLTYWGYADITSLLQTDAKVTLIPDCARFVAEESSVSGFTIGGIKLINTANKGYIAPAGWEYDNTTPNVPADDYSGTSGDCTSPTIYCFEAAAGKMRVIVKGTYGGVEGYYKAALIGGDGNEIAVLRNHSYTLKVTSVNHVGYSTEEAAKGAPEANIKVEVVDNESEIVNLTSNGKDLLGVSKDVTVEATATSAMIKVFTTLSSVPEVKYDGFSWVTAHSSVSADVTESSTQKAGKLYTLTLTLSKNSESDQSRTAEVTIRSGQMSRVVKVTQSGADFSTDREIHRVVGGTGTTLDLKGLMMSVKGLYPQYNQGVVRHIGLHFEPFRTDIYFKIKKIAGDETPSGNEYFTISDGGDYWEVKLNTSLENYSSALWTSSFSIKNDKKTYNYPVYHCGLFHKVSDTEIYYYEVVKVTGKSGTVYNILDRNLGATRNDFYSPESSALESYRDACGGYYKITTAELVASKKENNLESSIVPSGYEIPTDAILEDLNILTEIATASNGDQYTRVYLATCGDSQIERIYLPLAGYYEDVEHKNTTHCNLWSKSLLAGTQGFSDKSAEYGYWYRYLDFVGTKQVISNMRFVTGSSGTSTGRYKTMPVRCIHP